MSELSFFDPRLSHRLRLGVRLSLGAPLIALLSVALAPWGGRFQVVRGSEHDLWVEAGGLALGYVIACLVGTAFGPLWRRRAPASLLAATCGFPLAALQSLAENPHGPAPYHIHWIRALSISVVIGGLVAWRYGTLARVTANAHAARLARRRLQDPRTAG